MEQKPNYPDQQFAINRSACYTSASPKQHKMENIKLRKATHSIKPLRLIVGKSNSFVYNLTRMFTVLPNYFPSG